MATATRPVTTQERAIELNVLARRQRSLWGDAGHRLLRNKAAIVGLAVIALAAFLAIFAPLIAPYSPTDPFTAGGKQAPTL
ncbi:MAG: ABC transporter permease, partial [Chloroflexota bacterium]